VQKLLGHKHVTVTQVYDKRRRGTQDSKRPTRRPSARLFWSAGRGQAAGAAVAKSVFQRAGISSSTCEAGCVATRVSTSAR